MEAFVSFSSRKDREANFIRLLMSRLAEHGITPWVYESVSGAIPVGEDINDYCRRKIDAAQLVIVIVSESTTCPTSHYTHAEVDYIVSQMSPVKTVLPLKITDKAWQHLPGPYQKLAGVKGHFIKDFTALPSEACGAELETFLQSLCGELRLDYCPPLDQLLRLPIQSNLNRELLALQTIKGKDWATDAIARVRQSMLDLAGFIEARQFEDAQQEVAYILRLWLRELSAESCQYAQVLKYVVAIQQLADEQKHTHLQAQELRRQFSLEDIYGELKQSLEDPMSSLLPDGNVHGLLGLITYKLNDFTSAREHYQEALQCIRQSGGEDVLVRSNILLCTLAEASEGVSRASTISHKLNEQALSGLKMIKRGQFVSNSPGDQGRFYLVCLLSLLGCRNIKDFHNYFEPAQLASSDVSDLLPIFIDHYLENANVVLEIEIAMAILQLLNSIIDEAVSKQAFDNACSLLLERRCRLQLLVAERQADPDFLGLALTDASLLNHAITNYPPYQFMEAQIRIYSGDLQGARGLLDRIRCGPKNGDSIRDATNPEDSYDYQALSAWLLGEPVTLNGDTKYHHFQDLKYMLNA